jgi:hypothetical protein
MAKGSEAASVPLKNLIVEDFKNLSHIDIIDYFKTNKTLV